jgi:hypothetical protein
LRVVRGHIHIHIHIHIHSSMTLDI